MKKSMISMLPMLAMALMPTIEVPLGTIREQRGWLGSPIFIPKRGKFKGYMRENRKCSFNKNR
jgi:hypothetical protein